MSDDLLHWRHPRWDWDGEEFTVTIRHALDPWPTRWLQRNLPDRVKRVPDVPDDVLVSVVEVVWDKNGIDEWGELVIGGLRSPLPDPNALREHVDAAVREAEATAPIAGAEIEAFCDALKRGPSDS